MASVKFYRILSKRELVRLINDADCAAFTVYLVGRAPMLPIGRIGEEFAMIKMTIPRRAHENRKKN